MANTYPCDECGAEMAFLKNVEPEWEQRGNKIVGPVASAFYECPKHGLKRVFISGQILSYKPKKEME